MREQTFSYSEIKDAYLSTIKGERITALEKNHKFLMNHKYAWSFNQDEFYGATSKAMEEWLKSGYKVESLILDPPIIPLRKRRRLNFRDEGELQLDLMWSGHDYPFLDWTKRDIMPGMRVDISLGFASIVNPEVIADFNRWVLRALVALESAGVDLEIWVNSVTRGLFARGDETVKVSIQVKKEGEQSDYLMWSPLMSPGGYRHLYFLADVLAADRFKRVVNEDLGYAVSDGELSVKYNSDTQTIKIGRPAILRSFSEEEMDLNLREVLAQARRTTNS